MRFGRLLTLAFFCVAPSDAARKATKPAKPPAIHWSTYTHSPQDYRFRYPRGWDLKVQEDSTLVSSPGSRELRAAFGIMKRLYADSWEAQLGPRFSAPDK